MIDPIFQTDTYQLARKLLDAAALRHEAIATNVANAETPGYRRLDVAPDFAAKLRGLMEAGRPDWAQDAIQPKLVQDPQAHGVRPDGNNVAIERELLAMTRNAVDYDYLGTVVSSNFKQLKLAITGRAIG